MKPYLKRAWAEVSLPVLKKNIRIIRSMCKENTEIMAVVKADAYGHGDTHVVKFLYNKCGVKYFAVSNLDEAITVRENAPDADILILGYTPPEYAHESSEYNIIQGVTSYEYACLLSQNTPSVLRCHVKIDTGMGRIGLRYDSPEQCADEIVKIIQDNKKLSVEGIYTHFAAADSLNPDDIAYTDSQEKFILDTYKILAQKGFNLPRPLHEQCVTLLQEHSRKHSRPCRNNNVRSAPRYFSPSSRRHKTCYESQIRNISRKRRKKGGLHKLRQDFYCTAPHENSFRHDRLR